MKVVLVKNVPNLGQAGQVCTVSDGHARNLLFPRKLAIPATAQALEDAKRLEKKRRHVAETNLHATESIAEALDGYELVMKEKANERGTLFASISKRKLAERLFEKGFRVDENHIKLREPLKEVGEHDVTIEFPHGLEVTIRVIIEAGK